MNKRGLFILFSFIITSFIILMPYKTNAYATYLNNIYVEDYNNYGQLFTNTSGWQNVSYGYGNRPTGLQLNYTSIETTNNIPLDSDNWTEHSSHVSDWSIGGVADSLIERTTYDFKSGAYSIRFRYNDTGTTGFWILLQFGADDRPNILGYEKFGYWISPIYDPALDTIPILILEDLQFIDNTAKQSIIYPSYLIDNRFFPWLYHSFDLDNFTTDVGFNYSNIQYIYWSFNWYPPIYNRTAEQIILLDGVHFESPKINQYTFEDTGVWYSDWITLSGTGKNVFINTTNNANVILSISNDNSSWNVLSSSGSSTISQYGYDKQIILRIQLSKTGSGDSPIVDYVIITSISQDDQIPFIPPISPTVDPLMMYGIIGGLGIAVVIMAIVIIRKSKS